ncbi:MAG: Trk system potassium transporter TrkA [Clostridia bacterium]|nr:Trk system potassium transporter TrkA [Clostridia bacterium]
MNIIICGCGKIGTTLVASLVEEGHNITLIDSDAAVVDQMQNIYDVIGIIGNAADCDVLREAGVEDASLFVAASGSDETNMLACFLAKRMGAKHTIARIRNPQYNSSSLVFLRQQLDLSMAINPDLLAAQELYNILKFPSAIKIESFSRRDFEMIEIRLKPDSPLDGMSLLEMRAKYNAKVLICAVQRDSEVFIPGGDFVLHSGDRVGLTAAPTEVLKFFKALNVYQKQARDVILLGGSRVAFYLANLLTASGTAVKLIDRDPAVCQMFSDELPKVNVILGDGAKQELLLEEGIKDAEAFVALTGMDEENILTGVLANSYQVPKVIVKVNREELISMAENLGLDTIISPPRIISDVLIRYARALNNSLGSNVETMYNLMDGKAEALEFRVSADFPFLNVPLRNMKFKKIS